MDILLNEMEARVLGSLIEKELTTPAYYPLSLNALVNACNQKSNRDPFMNLDEDAVREALRSLNQKELAGPADNMESRVKKYEHRLQEAFNFTRHEIAILCELLLRGPQTPGELRNRADRMHTFDDLGIVQSTLQRLMKRGPPLCAVHNQTKAASPHTLGRWSVILRSIQNLRTPPVRNLTHVVFIFVPAVDFVHRHELFQLLAAAPEFPENPAVQFHLIDFA